MENVYRNFYRNFYKRTNGFTPVSPLGQVVYPGDFFQIRKGQLVVLGNIFRDRVVEPQDVAISYHNQLSSTSWNFSDGVTKPYSGRGSGHGPIAGEFEFSKQVLAFAAKGSFIFKANEPEAIKIMNWNDIQQALIIRLTQTYYSFREVYVVTESATTADWTLAIAGAGLAELEIATDVENFGLVDLFGHSSSKTIQAKDIEYYQREEKRKTCFYRAKKLVVNAEKMDNLTVDLIEKWQAHSEWARTFYTYDFDADLHYPVDEGIYAQGNLLDLLPSNELNPNTALLYFKWVDTNLDDIERLFINDGE